MSDEADMWIQTRFDKYEDHTDCKDLMIQFLSIEAERIYKFENRL